MPSYMVRCKRLLLHLRVFTARQLCACLVKGRVEMQAQEMLSVLRTSALTPLHFWPNVPPQALGNVEWAAGNGAAAREVWQRGLDGPAGPSAPLLCYWAQREAWVHNFRKARELLAAAQQADPGHPQSALLLASLEDRAGDRQGAAALYKQAQGLRPGRSVQAQAASEPHAGQAGKLDRQAQSVPAGNSSASQARETGPVQQSAPSGQAQPQEQQQEAGVSSTAPSPQLLHAMACYQLKHGDKVKALELLQQIERQDPCNGHMCHTRGLLAQQEGQLAEAREWFSRGTQGAGGFECLCLARQWAALLCCVDLHGYIAAWRSNAGPEVAHTETQHMGPLLNDLVSHLAHPLRLTRRLGGLLALLRGPGRAAFVPGPG